jgi:hypothetical protein
MLCRPYYISYDMKTEFVIFIFTFLGCIICFVVYKYYEQTLLNVHLKREFSLLYKIRIYRSFICKRQSHLDRYDFESYNLNDSLFEQDYPDFDKNPYF